jgi:hypothetical protein
MHYGLLKKRTTTYLCIFSFYINDLQIKKIELLFILVDESITNYH